ncbi:hypothetical protein BDD43_5162 [Mucilaginibacter gracilis]|uniref:Uncharacterized protein n=1 Tax=Mucilaginibacter gracilis TaxID=423350 RepID=A0A495JA18_9SPHI|nr:hypothetical protein [Mucilaginibacter gracilis]RKR84909.1 hypothetical protein BDD43_5162 [Mucilaginibacter gracilis]
MDIVTPPAGGWQVLSAQIAQRQPQALAYLNQVYKQLFNQDIKQGCGNCYQKAFYRIQKYLYLQQQNNPSNILSMTYPTRKYLLKPDRSLQTTFGGDTLTNDNLTDEAAEKLLQAHPALLQHFDRYPGKDDDVVVVITAPAPQQQPEEQQPAEPQQPEKQQPEETVDAAQTEIFPVNTQGKKSR